MKTNTSEEKRLKQAKTDYSFSFASKKVKLVEPAHSRNQVTGGLKG